MECHFPLTHRSRLFAAETAVQAGERSRLVVRTAVKVLAVAVPVYAQSCSHAHE